ncbi:IS3 family transposase [Paraburkholderia strydomiana]
MIRFRESGGACCEASKSRTKRSSRSISGIKGYIHYYNHDRIKLRLQGH